LDHKLRLAVAPLLARSAKRLILASAMTPMITILAETETHVDPWINVDARWGVGGHSGHGRGYSMDGV
jgi:hypothetical protein